MQMLLKALMFTKMKHLTKKENGELKKQYIYKIEQA